MGEPKIAISEALLRVEISFPEPLPITDAELALIEVHLNAMIAQLIELEASEGKKTEKYEP